MNRKSFFRTLVGGAIGLMVAPKVIQEERRGYYELSVEDENRLTITEIGYNVQGRPYMRPYIRIKNDGFYFIGDRFRSFDAEYIVTKFDGRYLYAYPI